jgi:hypothetical protein
MEENENAEENKNAEELIRLYGHPCPFQEEMNGNYENYCTCDSEQTQQCAMEV